MSNKCRVCLDDAAMHFIFDEGEDSVQFKFSQCFKEKLADVEGYPRSICDSCYDFINTTFNFITKYHKSDKLLNTLIDRVTDVIKEVTSDNSDDEIIHEEEEEIAIIKEEPETDLVEPVDDTSAINPPQNIINEPTTKVEQLVDVKEKLKNLKEIHVKSITATNAVEDEKSPLEPSNHCKKERVKCPIKEPRKKQPRIIKRKKKPVTPKEKQDPANETNLCDICGKTFNDKYLLIYHRQKNHLNTPRECTECQKVLSSDYNLKRHMNRIHGNKSFVCDTCGKKFAFVGELNTHVKNSHLKLRPKSTKKFACDKCDRHYCTRKALLVHNRSAHTGERPSMCSICGASFYHDDYLNQHMRLHTGETPFKCPVCNRGYAQEGNMRSHMKYNHRLSDLSPEEIKAIKPNMLKCLKQS